MFHAFLIIANRDLYTLNKLLEMIDNENHDIFILVDKKSKLQKDNIGVTIKKSHIYQLKRVSIKWGRYSLIDAELLLFHKANQVKKYDYYHIISGQDLLICNTKTFDDFFEKHKDSLFISYSSKEWQKEALKRVKYYYFFVSKQKTVLRRFGLFLVKMQSKIHVNRIKNANMVIYGGDQWLSITNEAVEYILNSKKIIKKIFKFSDRGDELFIQTIIGNSHLKNKIYRFNNIDGSCLNNIHSNKRYIDWDKGNPYVYREADFERIISSDSLFARKFDSQVDVNIINSIASFFKTTKKEN